MGDGFGGSERLALWHHLIDSPAIAFRRFRQQAGARASGSKNQGLAWQIVRGAMLRLLALVLVGASPAVLCFRH